MFRATDKIAQVREVSTAYLLSRVIHPSDIDRAYFETLVSYANVVGLDAGGLAVQSMEETANHSSIRWTRDRNPAGIAIVSSMTEQPFVIPDGVQAAILHLQCVFSLITGGLHSGLPDMREDITHWLTSVWLPKVRSPFIPKVTIWSDLGKRYAEGPQGTPRAVWAWEIGPESTYGSKLQSRAAELYPDMPDQSSGGTMPASFLIVAGHQSTDVSQSYEEAKYTPIIADAYVEALHDLNFPVTRIPDRTYPSLSAVASVCAEWMRDLQGNGVMIDCHIEGGHSQRGLFAIVPDRLGLSTAAPVVQPAEDVWANNLFDRRLGSELARALSASTGIPQRYSREIGLMSETQTGVATTYGARLAMFAYTSPYYERVVRLVVEHGNLGASADAAIIRASDFKAKVRQGVRAALLVYYSGTPQPEPEPEPTPDDDDNILPNWPVALASRAFGKLVTEDGKVYKFDPNGPVSKQWVTDGKLSGNWPPLAEVWAEGERSYYRFEGGRTYVRESGKLTRVFLEASD